MNYVESTAVISDCGLYRYVLKRTWNPEREVVVFLMLNPSRADASDDDATIRRCVGFADSWGYGRLVVVNLFAFRATDPKELRLAADPVGPANDETLHAEIAGRIVVCAWGATASAVRRPVVRNRPAEVRRMLAGNRLRHLGLTEGGHPKHPLRLRADLVPLTFPSEGAER